MELQKAIESRRSIRRYDPDRAVEEEKLRALLESARLCQSAHNRQPWRFMVLKGEKKDQIAGLLVRWLEENPQLPDWLKAVRHSAEVICQAPVLILVFREHDPDWEGSDLLSVGAAIEHICLTAVELGLGSVWLRDPVFVEEEIAALVGWPLQLVSAVSVGYPAEDPGPRPRLPLDKLMLEPEG